MKIRHPLQPRLIHTLLARTFVLWSATDSAQPPGAEEMNRRPDNVGTGP